MPTPRVKFVNSADDAGRARAALGLRSGYAEWPNVPPLQLSIAFWLPAHTNDIQHRIRRAQESRNRRCHIIRSLGKGARHLAVAAQLACKTRHLGSSTGRWDLHEQDAYCMLLNLTASTDRTLSCSRTTHAYKTVARVYRRCEEI